MDRYPIKTLYQTQLMQSHQFQGALNDCGPFVTAIILNSLIGTNLDGFELGKRLNHIRWYGPIPFVRRIPNWATFPWGITNFLREFGITAKWRVFPEPSILENNLSEDKLSVVIIGEWKPLWAHYLILAEYSPDLGYGFIDPAQNSSNIHWQEKENFFHLWNNYLRSVITISPSQ